MDEFGLDDDLYGYADGPLPFISPDEAAAAVNAAVEQEHGALVLETGFQPAEREVERHGGRNRPTRREARVRRRTLVHGAQLRQRQELLQRLLALCIVPDSAGLPRWLSRPDVRSAVLALTARAPVSLLDHHPCMESTALPPLGVMRRACVLLVACACLVGGLLGCAFRPSLALRWCTGVPTLALDEVAAAQGVMRGVWLTTGDPPTGSSLEQQAAGRFAPPWPPRPSVVRLGPEPLALCTLLRAQYTGDGGLLHAAMTGLPLSVVAGAQPAVLARALAALIRCAGSGDIPRCGPYPSELCAAVLVGVLVTDHPLLTDLAAVTIAGADLDRAAVEWLGLPTTSASCPAVLVHHSADATPESKEQAALTVVERLCAESVASPLTAGRLLHGVLRVERAALAAAGPQTAGLSEPWRLAMGGTVRPPKVPYGTLDTGCCPWRGDAVEECSGEGGACGHCHGIRRPPGSRAGALERLCRGCSESVATATLPRPPRPAKRRRPSQRPEVPQLELVQALLPCMTPAGETLSLGAAGPDGDRDTAAYLRPGPARDAIADVMTRVDWGRAA